MDKVRVKVCTIIGEQTASLVRHLMADNGGKLDNLGARAARGMARLDSEFHDDLQDESRSVVHAAQNLLPFAERRKE